MRQEVLHSNEGSVEITAVDNVIYMRVRGCHTDAMAFQMTQYLDKAMDQLSGPTIRVFDTRGILPDKFRLTSDCVQKIARWSKATSAKRPGSEAYFITEHPLLFGMARMYELQADDDKFHAFVLKSFDELPASIREKLPERDTSGADSPS